VHPSWQSFLTQQGASIEAGAVRDFGAPADELRAAQAGDVIADLSQFGVIEVSGADAREFLNNQLTNDLTKLDAAHAMYAGYCSAKGRLLASFLVWQSGENFLLQLDARLREAIQKRLSMYVLRAKVKLRDASEEWVRIGMAGANAARLVVNVAGIASQDTLRAADAPSAPRPALPLARDGAVALIRLDAQRFEIIAPAEQAIAFWRALAPNARAVGTPAWRWLDIRAGIAWIGARTQEQFVPQMVNFDRIGALSYNKGCYPGQEIVARTHYLGKVKRRMQLVHIGAAQDAAPQAGDELFSAALDGQGCGMLVDALPGPQGGFDALAVMQQEALAGDIHIRSMSGLAITILALPYDLL
jgi:tRNA-modifying protein YgfZ